MHYQDERLKIEKAESAERIRIAKQEAEDRIKEERRYQEDQKRKDKKDRLRECFIIGVGAFFLGLLGEPIKNVVNQWLGLKPVDQTIVSK